jgi:uncharacterized protein YndB with AHSA1/START domain
MSEHIEISGKVPATPARVYAAWLDSGAHSAMTGGGPAHVDPVVGGHFAVHDNYITGTNLELVPDHRIVQAWRSTEFPLDAPDSQVEVDLHESEGGTMVTIRHTNIPDGQGQRYEAGWRDYYLGPMVRYFGAPNGEPAAARAPKPAPARKKAAKKAKPKAKAKAKAAAKTAKKSKAKAKRGAKGGKKAKKKKR